MLHEMLHDRPNMASDLRLCVCLKIGRSAVRPRPWPRRERPRFAGAFVLSELSR